MLAKLVGEGYEKPNGDAELPLDVNYAKLSEWLVDRKQVPADWNRKLQAIQAKAAEAAKELPPGFLGQFDGGDAPLDYFRAKQVLGKLTESAERGLLGALKGNAGAWERVVKAYEANVLHMAEAGLTLARNADYEIPYYRKLLAKNQQVASDLERRQAEALKSSVTAAAEFRQECAQLGLGESATSGGAAGLRAGLAGLAASLPRLMEDAVSAVKAADVADAIAYYGAFVAMGGQAGSASGDLLPVLDEVRAGRTAAAPPGFVAPGAAAEGKEPEVVWELDAAPGDAGGGEESADTGLSWDLDAAVAAAGGGDGGIAWEVDIEPPADVEGADAGGISWDIDVSGAGEESAEAAGGEEETEGIDGSAQPLQQPSGSSAGYAAALGAAPAGVQRLCMDGEYRARLLDDLHELRAFLLQRCSELSSRGIELIPPSAPDAVAAVGPEAAAALRSAVDAAIAALSGERLSQLVSLAGSTRYRERLLEALLRRAGQERKFERAAAEAAARWGEVQRQLVADSTRLGAVVRHTREVKAAVEAVLGARLGRRVNVQGEINSLLAQQH